MCRSSEVVQILRFPGVAVKTPVEVKVDNVGAIYMSQNQASSTRTRHMDTRWFYVNDLQDDGLIIVKFVRSEDNVSDVATKNVSADTMGKHIQQRGTTGIVTMVNERKQEIDRQRK